MGPAGALGGHHQVGQQRQHPAGAGHRAGHGADHRRLELPQLLEQPLVVGREIAVVERRGHRRAVRSGGDIGARAEVAVVAGYDDGPHRPAGVGHPQALPQLLAGGHVDHVAALRPIEREHGDRLDLLGP